MSIEITKHQEEGELLKCFKLSLGFYNILVCIFQTVGKMYTTHYKIKGFFLWIWLTLKALLFLHLMKLFLLHSEWKLFVSCFSFSLVYLSIIREVWGHLYLLEGTQTLYCRLWSRYCKYGKIWKLKSVISILEDSTMLSFFFFFCTTRVLNSGPLHLLCKYPVTWVIPLSLFALIIVHVGSCTFTWGWPQTTVLLPSPPW
jgi:hypothetical protein